MISPGAKGRGRAGVGRGKDVLKGEGGKKWPGIEQASSSPAEWESIPMLALPA